ncbi:MAG: hypothetical protein CSB48_03130 [Proteobacteria bacterium]|nr:MAG: hypothetical protein CSB48_03130 [Pseudomonadota bacterium]
MQQINLYTDELRPRKTPLSLLHMVTALVLVILVLVGVTIVTYREHQSVTVELAKKREAAGHLEQGVESLRERTAGIVRNDALAAANDRLQKQLENRERFVDSLGAKLESGSHGFSSLLVGLARQKRDHLWLTRVHVSEGGGSFGLEGVASSPELVPQYIQALRAEPAFSGRSFDLFEMNQSETSHLLDFSLTSGKPESAESESNPTRRGWSRSK